MPRRDASLAPLSQMIGLSAACAVATPVIAFVWPGPSGDQANTRLAGNSGPGVRHGRGGALVPDIYEPERGADRRVVDRQYLVAGECEDIARTLVKQRANEYTAPPVIFVMLEIFPWLGWCRQYSRSLVLVTIMAKKR